LKVKVFPFLNTSLKVKVLKLLLKYSNALLLLRYCTTLATRMLLFQLCKSGCSLVRPMCFDSTASSIERKGDACDDSNPAWQDSVVPSMCTML